METFSLILTFIVRYVGNIDTHSQTTSPQHPRLRKVRRLARSAGWCVATLAIRVGRQRSAHVL